MTDWTLLFNAVLKMLLDNLEQLLKTNFTVIPSINQNHVFLPLCFRQNPF